MAQKKHYTGDFDALERKLARVCERLGVPEDGCRYDWTSSRGGNSCFVEICINGTWRRFENSTEKSAECGRGLTYASDLFAAIVLTLEDMARASEQGIVSFDQLVTGIPALPATAELEPARCLSRLDRRQKAPGSFRGLGQVSWSSPYFSSNSAFLASSSFWAA